MDDYPDDLSAPADSDLLALRDRLVADIRVDLALLESPAMAKKRTRRVVRGTVLNFIGLVASVPTGGITLLLCAGGMLDWAEVLVEDARMMNEQREKRRMYNARRTYLDQIRNEMMRRGLC